MAMELDYDSVYPTFSSAMIRPRSIGFLVHLISFLLPSESACRSGCDLALGAYYVSPNDNLSYISGLFGMSEYNVLPYNPDIRNPNSIQTGARVHVNFSCDCINRDFLGHNFSYVALKGDTFSNIATQVYANLTTADSLAYFNSLSATAVQEGAIIAVILNCSCGDAAVSKDYGLFETYPLVPGENLSTVAAAYNLPEREDLLRRYNLGSNFLSGERIFIPTKDASGSYRPLSQSAGYWPLFSSIKSLVSVTEEYKSDIRISGGAIAGIIIAALVVLLLGICLFLYLRRRRTAKNALLLPAQQGASLFMNRMGVTSRADSSSPFAGITVDRSVEFSYEELATATDDFGLVHKIGGGGFGTVYYAELRGEKAAVKKMDMQATSEFLAELKVLTNVHHLNLVHLIGYCTEVSLFLVYEFIENGNLSEHLRGLGKEPLPWMTRVQIALDSARGLEYIHEHTVPVYIHRDIKSANILIDKNFHAKVADFGLAKLTDVGASLQTRLVGTFGYMPPEYAQYGEVSPKVDVYAFGVVLYELISGKDAIVKTNGSTSESKGLVALFEEAFRKPDPKEVLREHVDPRLDQAYPLDSVLAMAWLARSCTQENSQQRPTMKQIVVALMTLSSPTEVWDMSSYDNQSLVNLMMGR